MNGEAHRTKCFDKGGVFQKISPDCACSSVSGAQEPAGGNFWAELLRSIHVVTSANQWQKTYYCQ
jgi:hypothetical protein